MNTYKNNSKTILTFYFLFLSFFVNITKAENNNNLFTEIKDQLSIDYLESKRELEDYILDSGDVIYLDFMPANELSGLFPVSQEGELLLPRLDETYVRGLTTSELKKLLEKRYAQFLIEPEIKARIAVFRSIRVFIEGELRNPGMYKFPSYKSSSYSNLSKYSDEDLKNIYENNNYDETTRINSKNTLKETTLFANPSNIQFSLNGDIKNAINISDLIRKSGGITSKTDLSRIEIVRELPLGKGGGKKIAVVDFSSLLNDSNTTNDIRLFDGDRVFIPSLNNERTDQTPKSILSGLSPRFIEVNVYGRVENTGTFMIPLEGTLSDAIDITGPVKPLSGKVYLIRYNKNGTITKKKISYSGKAPRGSKNNPFIKEGDLITVTNSVFGKTTSVLKEITEPFRGIYSTKKLIQDF